MSELPKGQSKENEFEKANRQKNELIYSIVDEVSEMLGGKINEEEIKKTLEYFDYKCPYTGIDLRERKDLVPSRIIPATKPKGALNLYGNIVFTTREIEKLKRNLTLPEFRAKYPEIIQDKDELDRIRRIQKIITFQQGSGFNEKAKLLPEDYTDRLAEIYSNITNMVNDFLIYVGEEIERKTDTPVLKYKRIYEWANKPQFNHYKIIKLFLENGAKIDRHEFIDIITEQNISDNPYGAVSSMLTDAGNSYGKIFDLDYYGNLIFINKLQKDIDHIKKLWEVE